MKKTLLLTLLFTQTFYAQNISFVHATGSPKTAGTNQRGLTTHDLNNDGIKDLVVGLAYTNVLRIYLGTGTGQFNTAPGSPLTVNTSPNSVDYGDFNGDSHI